MIRAEKDGNLWLGCILQTIGSTGIRVGDIEGGTFRDNSCAGNGGGAVYINAGCFMEMKNQYMVGNTQAICSALAYISGYVLG